MKRVLAELECGEFDLLIIGGGITGAGVALDATLRGLRVALIEKGDFGSGTSSVSSKLVHGGLRYLENAKFSLVHEALRERQRLLFNAPHLVWPLRFLLPFYRGARVRPWQWRIALLLYDLLAGRGNIQRSRPVTAAHIRHDWPLLASNGLQGGAIYHDAQMEDARLCLAVVLSAARAGACVANYTRATAIETRQGTARAVRVHDELTNTTFLVQARVILNAAGPWVDEVSQLDGRAATPHLETTKGVHLIVPDQGFASALLLLHPADGRVFFVLPWLGKTLIGTTDTFDANGPDRLHVTEEDIAYLLRGFNHYSRKPISADDVLHSFAGLRPLLKSRETKASSRSREFMVFTSPSGVLNVAGGKYTTYRSMAEKVTDKALQRLGRRAVCQTKYYLLEGATAEPWDVFKMKESSYLAAEFGLSENGALHLVQRYGVRARDVAAYIQDPEDLAPITVTEPDMPFEFRYQRDQEMAIREEDYLARRTRLGWLAPTELTKAREVIRNLSTGS